MPEYCPLLYKADVVVHCKVLNMNVMVTLKMPVRERREAGMGITRSRQENGRCAGVKS